MYLARQVLHTDPAVAQLIISEDSLRSIVMVGADGDLQFAVKLIHHWPEVHASMYAAYAQGTEQTQALVRWMKELGLEP